MYNGIGLQTARGSGTNGYVQTNKFFIRPRTDGAPKAPLPGYDDAAGGLGGMRKPNKEILEHDRKRQVELRLVLLRETLEEQGYTEGEIEERVEEARKEAEQEVAAAVLMEGASGGVRPPHQGKGFTDTQSHHVAARKEKQLETLRAALGLKQPETQKEDNNVDSDPESGELVPGKDAQELDIDIQKVSKASKDDKKHVKKGKKEKVVDEKSHNKNSRMSKHAYDSANDSDTYYDDNKRNKHVKKSFLDRGVDDEIDLRNKEKLGKITRHDSGADSDSDYGKKTTQNTKSKHEVGNKKHVSSSHHESKDEKHRRSKYKDNSYSGSESDGSDSDSSRDYNQKKLKSVKSSLHESKYDKHRIKVVRKGKYSDESDDDSDSGHDARSKYAKISQHDSKLQKLKIDVRKDQSHDKLKSDSRSEEHKKKRHGDISCHDSKDEKTHSKVLQKDKYIDESDTDSEAYVKEKQKPAKSLHHQDSKDYKQALKPKSKEKGANFDKNIDKRKRHDSDSDSDGYAHDRKKHMDAAVVRKDQPRDKSKSSPKAKSDEYTKKKPVNTSRHEKSVLEKRSSSGGSESDSSADSRENRKSERGLKNSNDRNYDERVSYKNVSVEKKSSQHGKRKDLQKQRHEEDERKGLEMQKQMEEEKQLEMQKQMDKEEKLEKLREEERQKEREHERRKGESDVHIDYKRKIGDDRYDPNSNKASDDEYKGHRNKEERRHDEHDRHRTRNFDSHDSKRSRHDDSYHHSRRVYEQHYSRDEYSRDRKHH